MRKFIRHRIKDSTADSPDLSGLEGKVFAIDTDIDTCHR